MANEGIPVSKDVIAWARKRTGMSQPEAAEKFAKIAAWEAGDAFPTYPQLEAMAEEFRIPVAVFFFPEPPHVPPIREILPHVAGHRIRAASTPDTISTQEGEGISDWLGRAKPRPQSSRAAYHPRP